MISYHHAEVRGQKIFYREAGSKELPTIVLLHGFPSSSHMFRDLIPKLEDKFRKAPFRHSPAGNPILEGVVAWIDCSLYAVHEAGDHFIAIGEISSFDVEHPHRPLLFFQGGYGQFSPFMKNAQQEL